MLYVVATPIGNLEDLTPRALRVLKNSEVILCEDTRKTGLLLQHFQIAGPRLVSYFEHNEQTRIPEVLDLLRAGKIVSLVTNAGTPAISDPGFKLIREVADERLEVVTIPGPCAAIAALAISGLPTDKFAFLGFLPKKSQQLIKILQPLKDLPYAVSCVAYESPYRLLSSLKVIQEIAGPEAMVSVHREMTKVHEESLRGTMAEVLSQLQEKGRLKGEITLVFRLTS